MRPPFGFRISKFGSLECGMESIATRLGQGLSKIVHRDASHCRVARARAVEEEGSSRKSATLAAADVETN